MIQVDLKTIDKIELWCVECPECGEAWMTKELYAHMQCPLCDTVFEIVEGD